MVAVLTNDETFRSNYEITLSFRNSDAYVQGMNSRLRGGVRTFPLHLRVPEISKSFENRNLSYFLAVFRFARYKFDLIACSFQNFTQLSKVLWDIRPEILHINNGGYPGALSCRIAVVAARLVGVKKVIMVVNNMALSYESPYRKLDFFLDRYVARNVSHFVTGSEDAASRLRHVLKLETKQVRAIPNGVVIRQPDQSASATIARYAIKDHSKLIFGVIGVMLPRKGHLVLLKALCLLSNVSEFTSASPIFLIEGEGIIKEGLVNFTAENGLSDFVRFVGSEPNIFNFYSVLDYLIYPSIVDEDFPNVISEALGMSIPVIASKVAGANEQIEPNSTGFLFERGSAEELAEIILKICTDPNLNPHMQTLAREKYELYYTPEGAVKRYLQLYANW
jgi:glycosyltransferase involved in cell wall biosynthesis